MTELNITEIMMVTGGFGAIRCDDPRCQRTKYKPMACYICIGKKDEKKDCF